MDRKTLKRGTEFPCLTQALIDPFRYRQLKQQHELKVEEEQILQAKVQQSSFHQQQEELERLRKAIGQNANTHVLLTR